MQRLASQDTSRLLRFAEVGFHVFAHCLLATQTDLLLSGSRSDSIILVIILISSARVYLFVLLLLVFYFTFICSFCLCLSVVLIENMFLLFSITNCEQLHVFRIDEVSLIIL